MGGEYDISTERLTTWRKHTSDFWKTNKDVSVESSFNVKSRKVAVVLKPSRKKLDAISIT